jgi:hypothetical protein
VARVVEAAVSEAVAVDTVLVVVVVVGTPEDMETVMEAEDMVATRAVDMVVDKEDTVVVVRVPDPIKD